MAILAIRDPHREDHLPQAVFPGIKSLRARVLWFWLQVFKIQDTAGLSLLQHLPGLHFGNSDFPILEAEAVRCGRASTLRNTSWLFGVVVYTGPQTRMAMNSREIPSRLGEEIRRPGWFGISVGCRVGLVEHCGGRNFMGGSWYLIQSFRQLSIGMDWRFGDNLWFF